MKDYKNSKLYVIRSYKSNSVYYGSTVQKLSQRMGEHRKNYKDYVNGTSKKYVSSYEILKYGDAYIELVKEVPCENVEQLKKLEGELILNNECVNKNIAGRQRNKWFADNKERIKQKMDTEEYKKHKKEYQKQYKEKNKEKLNEYRKKWRNNKKNNT